SAIADQAELTATAILAPPPGTQYEAWLVEDDGQRTSLGLLSLDSTGQGKLTFAGEQGTNLVAQYSGIEITIEPSPDPDTNPSGIVAYSFYYPQDALPHLRSLLSSSANTPNRAALIQGLTTDIQTINEFAKEMQKSSANTNIDRVHLYAEAILNILVGDQSDKHKDWNGDGQVDDPSDGFGLVLNGRNLGYLQATYIEADAAVRASGASEQLVTYGEGVKISVQDLAQWTEQLEELISSILASPSSSSIAPLVLQASTLAEKMVNGIDLDEDGVVEPVFNEAGVLVAYEQAYHMADMPLQAVGIRNLGTGTPTFVLVTVTPGGGGGRGGQTVLPTQNTPPGQQNNTSAPPPGQQKTPKPPPPGQQKTKEPPPGQQKTKKPNPGNTSDNNGNKNNGNNATPNVVP
ncbi:MAG: anti-sigma factor domain-containing protein, partial [Syntrophothermus sp.]